METDTAPGVQAAPSIFWSFWCGSTWWASPSIWTRPGLNLSYGKL